MATPNNQRLSLEDLLALAFPSFEPFGVSHAQVEGR